MTNKDSIGKIVVIMALFISAAILIILGGCHVQQVCLDNIQMSTAILFIIIGVACVGIGCQIVVSALCPRKQQPDDYLHNEDTKDNNHHLELHNIPF